jgi:hypothetical protein
MSMKEQEQVADEAERFTTYVERIIAGVPWADAPLCFCGDPMCDLPVINEGIVLPKEVLADA